MASVNTGESGITGKGSRKHEMAGFIHGSIGQFPYILIPSVHNGYLMSDFGWVIDYFSKIRYVKDKYGFKLLIGQVVKILIAWPFPLLLRFCA